MRRRAPALLVLALLLAGCAAAPSAVTTDAANGIRVGLTEWQIALAPAAALPGEITLDVTNAGSAAHDLRVDGAAEPAGLPLLQPGDSATLIVRVAPGKALTLWCSVPGHRDFGMEARLPVTAG